VDDHWAVPVVEDFRDAQGRLGGDTLRLGDVSRAGFHDLMAKQIVTHC
jgi:hypothetical protein